MSLTIGTLLVLVPQIHVEALNPSECYASDVPGKNVTCYVAVNGTVCLVCQIPSTCKSISWFRDDSRIYRNENSLVPKGFEDIYNTGCHGDMYSLRVLSVGIEQEETLHSCHTCNVTYGFTLLTRAKPVLSIKERHERTTDFHVLDCFISGTVSKVHITWIVNGEEVKHHSRNGSMERLHNYTVPFSGSFPKGQSEITCRVFGHHVMTTNKTITFEDFNEKNNDGLVALYISVPCLFMASILTSVFLYFKAKDYRQHKLEVSDRCDNAVDAVTTDEEVYDANVRVYSDIAKEEEATANMSATPSGGVTVILNSRLKASGMFEYWSATIVTDSSGEEKCFAKTLSSLATMKDATTFQELAMSLKSLKSNNYVVQLLSLSVEEIPYSVYYDYMECGSLRDFMLRRYQQARTSRLSPSIGSPEILPANVKSQIEELLTFASMIADALKFISSEKFSHPALSLKKVLLSEYCECKLYDIYPTEMAMTRINHLMEKDNPPIAWMAVETIFLQEYEASSDVWSFAILLWELFSLGEVPFARNSREEVEQKIREGSVLTQPLCCPGSIYGIMLSCWNNAATKRPTFENLLHKITNMVEKFKEQERTLPAVSKAQEIRYFDLDPDAEHNNYI